MLTKAAPSSYRDRTSEFLNVAERLRKSSSYNATTSYSSNDNGALDHPTRLHGASLQSEFNKTASRIGLGIHQTSQKLARLAQLAKRTSMFDDPVIEIQELTAVIKQDITALSSAIADLQVLCDSQNISGNISKQTTEHSTTVVDNLKSRLMNTTKEFKDVLTIRTENLKVHENRRKLFTTTASKRNPSLRQRSLGLTTSSRSSVAPPWANGLTSSSEFLNERHHSSGEPSAFPGVHSQVQQEMVPVQDNYMQSRAEALQNVESTIMELSNIFTQLATMVAQQGEIAIRIDENMDDTLANVEGAQGALLNYLSRISSNR
ncbi:hypothetical protein KI387_004953, partial [Taxus chinensis]